MNWAADELFRVLSRLFTEYGVPIVFLAAFAEATVGLGIVVPGIVMIFLAGAYAREEGESLFFMFMVANVGTALGDILSYGLGRWGGRFLHGTRLSTALRLGEALVSGKARWLIPFYHFNSVSRTLGPFGAGALRMPLRIWLPLDLIGVVLANAVYMGAGAIFGRTILTEDGRLNEHPALRIGIVVALVFYAMIVRKEIEKTRAAQRAEAEERTHQQLNPAPPSE